jgi:hypothetical protein
MGTTRTELHLRSLIHNITNIRITNHASQHVLDGNRLRWVLRPHHAKRSPDQQSKIWRHKNSMPYLRQGLARPPTPRQNCKRRKQKPLPTRSERKHPLRRQTGQRLCHPMLGRNHTADHCNIRTRSKRSSNELLHTTNHLTHLHFLVRQQKPHVHTQSRRDHIPKRTNNHSTHSNETTNTHSEIGKTRLRHQWWPPTIQVPLVRHCVGLERPR